MKLHSGSLVVLLVFIFTVYEVRSFKVRTLYQKNMDILNTVNNHDRLWRFVLSQNVYFSPNVPYWGHIVENELLVNAIDGGLQDENVSCESKGFPIKTEQFLRNLFQKRFVIGSILEMGLHVVQKAHKCLAYKNSIHLMTLVRVEITRKLAQNRAIKWSQRAKAAVSEIVMQMGGLKFTDTILLQAIKFLGFFDKDTQSIDMNKFNMISYLDKLIGEMLEFLPCNCVKAPKTAEEVAMELKVITIPDLYNLSMSKNIPNDKFKKMFNGSIDKIQQHFGGIKFKTSMSKDRWNEILNFIVIPGVKRKFIQIKN